MSMTSAVAPARIGLLGEGRLFEALAQRLADAYCLQQLQRGTLTSQVDQCRLVLTCHDNWSSAISEETRILERMPQVAWLPIYGEFGALVVGPWTRPGVSGCFSCAEHRRWCAVEDIEIYQRLRERLEQDDLIPAQPWLTSWGLQALLLGIEAEIEAIMHTTAGANGATGATGVKTARAVLQLDLATLQWSRHQFLPNPLCATCGELPLDSMEAAYLQVQTRQKPTPDMFRTRPLSTLADQIVETYVDAEYGLIHHIGKHPRRVNALMTAYARVDQSGRRRYDLPGAGRTLRFTQSHLAAIAEALERYAGQRASGKRTTVRGSFRQLQAQALDPATLGLYPPEQSAQPGFRFVPYHPDLSCDWVWGYSFGRQRPVLVPECYAYYGHQDDQAFVYECSNGCALGSCLEEAILYGMLEVLERDAFLLTWYGQVRVPRLDISSIPSQRVRWLIERLEYSSGYAISVFNTTLLHGAACCWVMGVDERLRAGFPMMSCAAGSHVLPEEALLSALLELASTLPHERPQEEWFQQRVQRAQTMFHDPLRVEEMADHSTLYILPEAFSRLAFLMQTPRRQTYQAAFAHLPRPDVSGDLTRDLSRLIAYYQAQGIDTIVVDQTTPEHRECGFSCAKVIMPGMLPMTFGHRYRRVHGFKRLAEVPVLMGYRTEPLTDADINPHPHPFP
jgi:ribosomal protein S12 methylthiotransferase accessory factor